MNNNNLEILEKAKNTPYNHQKWFIEGGKNVYEVMEYFVKTNDFYLDFSNRIQHINQLNGYKGKSNRKDIVDWLVEQKQYDKLIIRYKGKEKGTDRGILKVQTYLILLGHKNIS